MTTMHDRFDRLDDPQLRPFLPLLYFAWADGTLEDSERRAIVDRLSGESWMTARARGELVGWLDAERPPSQAELHALREVIESACDHPPQGGLRSLVALGTLVDAGASAPAHPEALLAARDVATILGVDSLEPAAVGIGERLKSVLPESSLDVKALALVLDGPLAGVRATVRSFLDAPDRHAFVATDDEHRALVRKWTRELASTGVFAYAFPGTTSDVLDLRCFFTAFETLAFADLSLLVKVGVQLGLFGGSIHSLGTEAHHALLPDVASLALEGCFALSEAGHGTNAREIETVARYDETTHELVIHTPSEAAHKDWIGAAARDAQIATVFAQLEVGGRRHGIHAILVPLRDPVGRPLPGVAIGDCGSKMGLNGVDNGRLWFDRVRVPVANLLDRFGGIDANGAYQSPIADPAARFSTMLGTLVGGRVGVGSAGVSIAKSALAIAIRYALGRRHTGPTGGREIALFDHPTHRRRLVPALGATYVLHFAFERLRGRHAEATRDPFDANSHGQFEAEAAALKVLGTRHAVQTVRECREACGAEGYLATNRLPQLLADCEVFATFEGDNTALLALVAQSLVTGCKQALGGSGPAGVLRTVSQPAAHAEKERDPMQADRTDSEHLRDRSYHLAALGHRETCLGRKLADRLQHRLDRGMDAHDALLEVEEHALAVAAAYADRLALEWFHEAVVSMPPSPARHELSTLGDLHALGRIAAELAWYLEDGSVEHAKARAIRKELSALIQEVAIDARGLVDAFGIPDACLAAPIAFERTSEEARAT